MIIRFARVKVIDDFDSQFHWSDGNESLIRVNPLEWRNDMYKQLLFIVFFQRNFAVMLTEKWVEPYLEVETGGVSFFVLKNLNE